VVLVEGKDVSKRGKEAALAPLEEWSPTWEMTTSLELTGSRLARKLQYYLQTNNSKLKKFQRLNNFLGNCNYKYWILN